MFVAVLVRKLREGKGYEDFLCAWYPDKGFDYEFEGTGPIVARNLADEREIVTIAYIDAPSREAVLEALDRVAEQEAVRHDRIDEVISTSVRGIYEVVDEFDFATDEGVARGRPEHLDR